MGKWELGIWEFHLLRIRISMPPERCNVRNSYRLRLKVFTFLRLAILHGELQRHLHPSALAQFQLRGSATHLNANPCKISHKGEVCAVRRISPPAGEIVSPYGREFLRPIRLEPVRASMPSRSIRISQ